MIQLDCRLVSAIYEQQKEKTLPFAMLRKKVGIHPFLRKEVNLSPQLLVRVCSPIVKIFSLVELVGEILYRMYSLEKNLGTFAFLQTEK